MAVKKTKPKLLTVQSLPDYMNAVEIPYKTFFEFCMGENKSLNSPDEEGWTEISFPTVEMERMAELLDKCSPKEIKDARRLIDDLQPEYYQNFRESLRVDSGEYLPLGRAASSRTEADSGIPVLLKEDNLGDRTRHTLHYMCDERHASLIPFTQYITEKTSVLFAKAQRSSLVSMISKRFTLNMPLTMTQRKTLFLPLRCRQEDMIPTHSGSVERVILFSALYAHISTGMVCAPYAHDILYYLASTTCCRNIRSWKIFGITNATTPDLKSVSITRTNTTGLHARKVISTQQR